MTIINRYSKKTIIKACRLREKGLSLRAIMKETGIKSTSTIQYQCDPDYRDRAMVRGNEWKKKNPKRWREINRKAVKRYQENKK